MTGRAAIGIGLRVAARMAEGEAEFGIASAKLACLRRRWAAAAATGANRLAAELQREIGETVAYRRCLPRCR